MKAKFVNENLNEYRKVNEPIITTVDELFTWYSGDDWANDWQTTNTMAVNREHAQDDGEDGMTHLKVLENHAQDEINVQYTDEVGAYDVWFTLDGDEYSIQSVFIPFKNY